MTGFDYMGMIFDAASAPTGFGRSTSTSTTRPRTTSTAPKPATSVTPPPPAGFTADQWSRLTTMSKTNTALADLIKQFTTPQPSQAWRRELPKDNTQLLRQLSFNAGEMGMPGGYVGAIQVPAYGSSAQPVNNPDMSKYGRAPGIGEATFYQQSMKGGMAPIAAMSPLGVPEGWNPGGTSTEDLRAKIQAYLNSNAAAASTPRTPTPVTNIVSMLMGIGDNRSDNLVALDNKILADLQAKELGGLFG